MKQRSSIDRVFFLARVGFALCAVCCLLVGAAGCSLQTESPTDVQVTSSASSDAHTPTTTLVEDYRNTDLGCGWQPVGAMELAYARCYTVDYYEGGFALVCVADGSRYLVVPEGASAPVDLSPDIVVIQQPVGDVYLAASDTMCLFDALGRMDCVTVSGIERDDWYVQAARDAMDAGNIVYGGKYRAPDYELLMAHGVRLSIQSTMINHTPEVKRKLEELGIPVLVEMSSYEGEPLGRAEWVRLYGLLCGENERAQEVFEQQTERVSTLAAEPRGKTVAFFYINANGAAVIRRPGDYVTSMIRQAGGTYVFDGASEAVVGSSSMTIDMEQFYTQARDADVLVYNSSIDNTVDSLEELLEKNALLADFAAVRNGSVWVTEQNMYQQMIHTGDIIQDFNKAILGSTSDLTYLRKLT